MEAKITELKLKRIFKKFYIKIKTIDSNGVVRYIDKPFINDDINFRKQIFGIMSACDIYDLIGLATDNPTFKKMVGCYVFDRLKILGNQNGEYLYYSKEKEEYILLPSNTNIIDKLLKSNLSNINKEEGYIQNIISQSGTFTILFEKGSLASSFIAGQIYWGFGSPIFIGNEKDIINSKKAARTFTTFIVNLMRLYGIDDLLDFGEVKDKFPIVDIKLNDKGDIISITNAKTGMGLSIGKEYNIIERQKEKRK